MPDHDFLSKNVLFFNHIDPETCNTHKKVMCSTLSRVYGKNFRDSKQKKFRKQKVGVVLQLSAGGSAKRQAARNLIIIGWYS